MTVVEYQGRSKHGDSLWLCKCNCGIEKVVASLGLKQGKVKSCGCFRAAALKAGRDQLHKNNTIHGQSRTREHHIWQNLIYRCYNPNCPQYDRYGGRGIGVCDKWKESFIAFYEDMGPCPSPKHTVDRIDNDGDYCPENCRWATRKQQANNRRGNRLLTYKGEQKTCAAWAEQFGLTRLIIWQRLGRGWSVEKTLETPPKGQS